MKRVAILLFFAVWTAQALPIIPLATTPDRGTYLEFVAARIASATEEVLVALSDLRLYAGDGATSPLVAALVAAAARGAEVRVLVDRRGDGPYREQQAAFAHLAERGVVVRWDDPQVTLHTKFLVVDRRWVVVGSTHWTASALTRSVQLDLAVEDEEVGAAFRSFFDLLWEGRIKASAHLPPPPWPRPAVVPLLDFPQGGLHAELIPRLIRQAQESVCAIIYRLGYYPAYGDSPSNRIVEELRAAASRGVAVSVLLEGGEGFPDLARDNQLAGAYLATGGAQVRFGAPETTLHAKCLIVDSQDVLISSANWSYASLVQNVEAGLAVLGAPALGLPLRHLFDELWDRARPLP
ncbi:hypothetical protein H5T55_06090 [Candidatus Bipolaricaulota bacterium]|nr:hypothetical protein [Candidatus Bipolaricaulota bacterium]